MPHFAYKILASNGQVSTGRMEAHDLESLRRQLQRAGGMIIEAREVEGAQRSLRSLRPGTKDLALATHEITMLLGAGQTVEQALVLLLEGAPPRRLRAPLAASLARLREGASLAEAMGSTGAFPPIYLAMVQAGEASGALADQLAKLAVMLDRAARLRDQMVSALIYPALLVVVAISAVILLLGLVVPQFAPLFEGAANLPDMTRLILAASAILRQDGMLILAGLAVLLLAVGAALRHPPVAAWCDDRLLRLPLIGSLLILAASARWMRVLAVLLKGGVALPAALALVRPVAGHLRLQQMIGAMQSGIKDGKGLTASLPPRPPLPDLALQLLRVGEQGGKLEESLGHLADLFDSRVEQSLKRLLAIFEPACVLLLSVMVGSIVISILLAVVSINDLAI